MQRENKKICALAVSLSGHDKDRIYVVVEAYRDYALLADGTHHKLSAPKKKNLKHIQMIRHFREPLPSLLEGITQDSDIVHVLRVWKNAKDHQEGMKEDLTCQNLT